jgi:hypothetical protein
MTEPDRTEFEMLLNVRGKPRKAFSSKQIPKGVRARYRIVDGMSVSFTVAFGKNVRLVESRRVTSGGELPLPNFIARELAAFASVNPEGRVRFRLLLHAAATSEEFDERVRAAMATPAEARRIRLAHAARLPTRVLVTTRNSDEIPTL